MKTDWAHTAPPRLVRVDAFIRGNIRHGWSDGHLFYLMEPCNDAFANAILDANDIEAWRYVEGPQGLGRYDPAWVAQSQQQLNGRIDLRGLGTPGGLLQSIFGW